MWEMCPSPNPECTLCRWPKPSPKPSRGAPNLLAPEQFDDAPFAAFLSRKLILSDGWHLLVLLSLQALYRVLCERLDLPVWEMRPVTYTAALGRLPSALTHATAPGVTLTHATAGANGVVAHPKIYHWHHCGPFQISVEPGQFSNPGSYARLTIVVEH